MCFRHGLRVLMAAIFAVTSSGCGLNMGESAPPEPKPSFSGKGLSCVGQIPDHFDRYVKDQLSEAEITAFVRCLQKSFMSFAQLTRGRDHATYTADEIRRFLEAYFLKDRPISDELLNEFMVIKQALVGGAIDRITRPELHVAIEILEDLRRELIRLKPHLQVLNPRLAVRQEPAFMGTRLNEAGEALRMTIQVLAGRLHNSKRPYTLANLEVFLNEFRKFVKWEAHFANSIEVRHWVAFLKTFKELTVSPQKPEQIRPSEWVPLLQAGSSWYLSYLQFEVGVRKKPILQGLGLQNAIHLSQEVFTLVEASVLKQPGKEISYQQLDRLVDVLCALRWVPDFLRPTSVKGALRVAFTKVFGDPVIAPKQRTSTGLGLDTIARMRLEAQRWARTQEAIEARYAKDSPQDSVLNQVPNLQTAGLSRLDMAARRKALSSAAWEDFISVQTRMGRPLYRGNDTRVFLVGQDELAAWGVSPGFHNLSLMNVLRSSTRLIFMGYSESGRRGGWDDGIRSDEFQQFYEDVREIGIDLGLIDKRNSNTGHRSFIEGNLFTYGADGFTDDQNALSGQLTFIETMQLFSFLFSGGQMAMGMYEVLRDDAKCEQGPLDINGRPMLDRACAKRHLQWALMYNIPNMPNLQVVVRDMTPRQRTRYLKNLHDVSFSPEHSECRWLELQELATLSVVLHYAEAVMTRFDADRNGTLSNPEVYRAVPVFAGFIKKFAKEKLGKTLSDAEARGAFLFILLYERMPQWYDVPKVWELSKDLSGQWDMGFVKVGINLNEPIVLDRLKLSTVFRVIIGKLFETGSAPSSAARHADSCVNPRNP